MRTNWKDTRVLILGAARQGLALARWLSVHGARVTVSDMRGADELRPARESLAEYQIDWALGGHPLELLDSTDVLCLSGGVPLTLPIVVEANKRGIPLTNDSQIFMEVVPCKTVGITGSAGKTTTTTLVGKMTKNVHGEKAFVGGNIGDPLLNYADEMKPDDVAVLELSSFQLEQMTLSPDIAAILNITPNHLDRHGTMEAYTAAKSRILEFQSKDDVAVLGRDDNGAWSLRDKVKGKLLAFSLNELEEGLDGSYLREGSLNLRDGKLNVTLMPREKIAESTTWRMCLPRSSSVMRRAFRWRRWLKRWKIFAACRIVWSWCASGTGSAGTTIRLRARPSGRSPSSVPSMSRSCFYLAGATRTSLGRG